MALATAVNDAAGREPTGRSADVTVGKDLGQSQHLGDADSQQQRHDSLGWLWLKLAQGCLEEAHAWLGLSFALRHHAVGPPPLSCFRTLERSPQLLSSNCPVRSNDALLVGRISEGTGSAGGAAPPRILILGLLGCVWFFLRKRSSSSQPHPKLRSTTVSVQLCLTVLGGNVVQETFSAASGAWAVGIAGHVNRTVRPRPAAGTELEEAQAGASAYRPLHRDADLEGCFFCQQLAQHFQVFDACPHSARRCGRGSANQHRARVSRLVARLPDPELSALDKVGQVGNYDKSMAAASTTCTPACCFPQPSPPSHPPPLQGARRASQQHNTGPHTLGHQETASQLRRHSSYTTPQETSRAGLASATAVARDASLARQALQDDHRKGQGQGARPGYRAQQVGFRASRNDHDEEPSSKLA